jgi:glutamine phosphoribosylpyrophosphate amidotransferase
MCGIAGILKRGTSDYPIGKSLLSMALCLQHRGEIPPESRFLALRKNRRICKSHCLWARRLEVRSMRCRNWARGACATFSPNAAVTQRRCPQPFWTRHLANIEYSKYDGNALDDAAFIHSLESGLNGATVSSMGRKMRVHKAVGRVEELTSEMSAMTGTHGIAHLRLATESRIDPAHAQPFWGRPYADIAVTHNGHITNYHKLRQKFEARGFSFASHNDSEIIGVYLGDKMDEGATLSEALQTASGELDGSFSFIVATANGLGVARDSLATKPLLFVENEEGVCLASEPQALYRVLGDGIRIREIKPRETRTWELE